MGRTIKGKLTISVIFIVVASILLTTAGIVVVAGRADAGVVPAERASQPDSCFL